MNSVNSSLNQNVRVSLADTNITDIQSKNNLIKKGSHISSNSNNNVINNKGQKLETKNDKIFETKASISSTNSNRNHTPEISKVKSAISSVSINSEYGANNERNKKSISEDKRQSSNQDYNNTMVFYNRNNLIMEDDQILKEELKAKEKEYYQLTKYLKELNEKIKTKNSNLIKKKEYFNRISATNNNTLALISTKVKSLSKKI